MSHSTKIENNDWISFSTYQHDYYLLFRISHISQKHTPTHRYSKNGRIRCSIVVHALLQKTHLFSTSSLFCFTLLCSFCITFIAACKCLSTCIPLYVHPQYKWGTKERERKEEISRNFEVYWTGRQCCLQYPTIYNKMRIPYCENVLFIAFDLSWPDNGCILFEEVSNGCRKLRFLY